MKRKKREEIKRRRREYRKRDARPILFQGHLWSDTSRLTVEGVTAKEVRTRLEMFRDAGLLITRTGPSGETLVRVDYEIALQRAAPELLSQVEAEARDYEQHRHVAIVNVVHLTMMLVSHEPGDRRPMDQVAAVPLEVQVQRKVVFPVAELLYSHGCWPPTVALKKVPVIECVVHWDRIVEAAREYGWVPEEKVGMN